MKFLAIAATSALIASQSFAGSYEVRCETTKVPYQETVKGGQPEKVIGGALVGGVIGKAVTDKTAGAAVGAVIGGAVGHENSRTTVTRYKDVETCETVFVPERVTDAKTLQRVLMDLNEGQSVNKEMVMDVQYTIGVAYDGKWGPKSKRAAEDYLASLEPRVQPERRVYSLIVNDVVIASATDATEIDEMKKALFEAGVDSQILVDLR